MDPVTSGGDTRRARPDVLHVTVTRLTGGRGVRLTSSQLRGWSVVAAGPGDIARGIDSGWVELDIAAYSHDRATATDLEVVTPVHDPAPGTPAAVEDTRDALVAAARATGARFGTPRGWGAHDPAQWTPLPGGSWRSPTGRTYGQDTAVARKVVRKRADRGLPTRAEP